MAKKHSMIPAAPIVGQYRQGDVLIEFTPDLAIPADAVPVEPEGNRVVLAHGEVTGHAHAFYGKVAMFRAGEEGSGGTYVHVKEPDSVVHDEHTATPINKGVARVIRQREYSPEVIRNVAD